MTPKLWENSRLRSELEDLKRELAVQRAEWQHWRPAAIDPAPFVAPPPALPPSAALTAPTPVQSADAEKDHLHLHAIMRGMLNARLQALESRLLSAENLRPPLASDRRRKEEHAMSDPASAVSKSPRGGPKNRRRAHPPPGRLHLSRPYPRRRGRWSSRRTAVRRPLQPHLRRLREPPHSSAVVITL